MNTKNRVKQPVKRVETKPKVEAVDQALPTPEERVEAPADVNYPTVQGFTADDPGVK